MLMTSTGDPIFSVIMPSYNHALYLPYAIQSVLEQSFPHWELVICDDASRDDSRKLLLSYDDPRIRVIQKLENSGTADALNSCLMASRGSLICWLSADDLYDRQKLAAHYQAHSSNGNIGVSIAPYGVIQGDKRVDRTQIRPSSNARLLQFLYGNYINGLSICVRREIYIERGLFRGQYKYAHDEDRWFCFLKQFEPYYIEGSSLSFTRIGTSSTIENNTIPVEIDSLKVIYDQLIKFGISAFRPVTSISNKVEILEEDYLDFMVKHFLSPNNRLSRLGFRDVVWSKILEYFSSNPAKYPKILQKLNFLKLKEGGIPALTLDDRQRLSFFRRIIIMESLEKSPNTKKGLSMYLNSSDF